jgi:hypothetical protein
MPARSLRRIALLGFLAIDFGLLSAATVYLCRGAFASSPPSTPSPVASVAPATSGSQIASAPPAPAVVPVPMSRATIQSNSAIRGSPRYIVCGTVDRLGRAWLGTEGQGVWAYQNHSLEQYSVAQGLPEDGVCAVACDALGRIWAGHEAHGLSIYNGQEWRNYDRFDGPGGSHVFAIATSPADGDLWIATENGVTRYSLKNDSWTHFDRSNGLPSAEVNAIAVDHAGDVFLALPDAGIACGRATENFAHWTVTTGPDDVPPEPRGAGLPGPIVNALLCTRADVLYAGTTRGLARSSDHGATWSFVQGANWAQLLKGSYGGTPAGAVSSDTSPLMEDWITALAEDASGALWIGYRAAGYQVFSGDNNYPVRIIKGKISAVVPLPGGSCVLGSVGDGAMLVGSGDVPFEMAAAPSFASALTAQQFPSGPKPISAEALDVLSHQVESLAPGSDGVDNLTDDWETIGDWPGRYGTTAAHIMTVRPVRETDGCTIGLTTGPFRQAAMRYYETAFQRVTVPDRGLIDPLAHRRTFWEHNDESYSLSAHPLWEEGPDLFVKIELPAGIHRVSLYFCNYEGHNSTQEWREYPLQVRRTGGAAAMAVAPATDDPVLEAKNPSDERSWLEPWETVDAELAPILCRSYVPRYWYGVYKQFLIRGQGTYWIKVVRNYSPCCKINGVFVDRMDAPPMAVTDVGTPWPTPPAVPDLTIANAVLISARRLWSSLDGAVGRAGYAAVNAGYRTLAYQAAAANSAPSALLANWRWTLQSWNKDDRDHFNATYGKGIATH